MPLRKMRNLKQWQALSPVGSNIGTSGSCLMIASTQGDGLVLQVATTTEAWIYNLREDAWLRLPSPALTSFGQPAGAYHPNGPTGTASAGSSTSITTVATIPGSVAGYRIRITGGTGAGQEVPIVSNTYGANSVITVASWPTATPDNTSTYLLLTGRFFVMNVTTTVGMKYYDVALNTWSSALVVTGVTAFSGSQGSAMVSTPGYGNTVSTGPVASATGTTLVTTKTWTASQWINSQVRIISGTGAGQVRTVTANTTTTLTVAAWSTNPDATSQYVIEPNDDFLYLAGGNAVTLYRYSISGNNWSTLSPGTARTSNAGNGSSLYFVPTASDASWANESTGIKNGRYLVSFSGGGAGNLALYDIAANAWSNVQTAYLRGGGTDFAPTSQWAWCGYQEFIYLMRSLPAGGQTCYRYNVVTQTLDPWTTYKLSQSVGAPAASLNMAIGVYIDPANGSITRYVYYQPCTGSSPTQLFRMQII